MPSYARAAVVLACLALPVAALGAPRNIASCTAITDSGSYVVTRNLTATGDCLVVQADFVTIDLDGYVIAGNGAGAGVTEFLSVGVHDVTVRNGIIRGFQRGIALGNSRAVRVERITATGNTFDAIAAGDVASIVGNTVADNGGNGVRLGQRALVTGNSVNDNASGILVGIGGNVAGNTVGHNAGNGISTAEGALVTNNVSRNNGSDGISVDCPSAVISNTTSNNQGVNLKLINSDCTDPAVCCVVTAHNSTL